MLSTLYARTVAYRAALCQLYVAELGRDTAPPAGYVELPPLWVTSEVDQATFVVEWVGGCRIDGPAVPIPGNRITELHLAAELAGSAVRADPLTDLAKQYPHAEALYAATAPPAGTPTTVTLARLDEQLDRLHLYLPPANSPAPAKPAPGRGEGPTASHRPGPSETEKAEAAFMDEWERHRPQADDFKHLAKRHGFDYETADRLRTRRRKQLERAADKQNI